MKLLQIWARAAALPALAICTTACASAATPAPASLASSTPVPATEPASTAPAATTEAKAEGLRADPAFSQRVNEIVQIMNGRGDVAQTFSPGFLAQVPADRLERMTRNMREAYGAAEAVSRVELQTPYEGDVFIDLERSQLELKVMVESQEPHRVRGLLIRRPGR